MDALTLTTGVSNAAEHAMDRIRSELGDAVADCVAGNASNSHSAMQQQSSSRQHQYAHNSSSASHQLSEREMTLKAMELVQELLNDTSTILYARGKSHILQQAMEDGSSVVCNRCGDMISRERWMQHEQYWCRAIAEEKGLDEDESMMMDD